VTSKQIFSYVREHLGRKWAARLSGSVTPCGEALFHLRIILDNEVCAEGVALVSSFWMVGFIDDGSI